MSPMCCVPHCHNTVGGHTFPRDPELRERWITLVRRDKWSPAAGSRVCHEHFTAEDYIATTTLDEICVRRKLKPGAVPSQFSWTKPLSPSVIRRRKRAERRNQSRNNSSSKLKEDMANHIYYSMTGGNIRLNPGVQPHKFACQGKVTPWNENRDRLQNKKEVLEILSSKEYIKKPDQDHLRRVLKISHADSPIKDIEVVEVKEEQTYLDEAEKMHLLQEQDPLSIKLEPVSWQPSSLQEELQPKGRESHRVYVKEEIDIKEEDIGYFKTEEVAEYGTENSLFQGPHVGPRSFL